MFELKKTEEVILEIMKEKNINQNQLSEMTGLTRPYITGVLSGNRVLSSKTIEKICAALGVDDEVKKKILFYELFNAAPIEWKLEFFDNFNINQKKELELRKYRKLDKFLSVVEDYILNDDDFKNSKK